MKLVIIIVLLPIYLVLTPFTTQAEELQESASYIYPETESDAQAKEIALARVKKKVLEKVCGTQITGGTGRFKSEGVDELSLFYFEMVGGRVSETRNVSRKINIVKQGDANEQCIKECIVAASVVVECDKGKRDPSFAPSFAQDVQINDSYLREGDEIIITLKAANDLYLTVFQYLPYERSEQKVFRIFPNDSQSVNLIKEGKALRIPDAKSEQRYKLVAQLPSKKEQVSEELMLVATRERVKFPDAMTLGDFQRILAEIPLNDRREAVLPYLIVKDKMVNALESMGNFTH